MTLIKAWPTDLPVNVENKVDKNLSLFNVKDYGAKGDGSTDDKTAIDAAISAANTNGGGIVFFPYTNSGYLTSGNHTIYSNIIYDLGGSTVKLKIAANNDLFITSGFSSNTGTNNTTDPTNYQIRNGFLDGNKANQTTGGCGLKMFGHNFIIENFFVYNCFSDGIYSEWANVGTLTPPTNNMEATMLNVKSSSNGGWGINWHGPHDSILNNVDAYSNTTGQFNFQANGDGTRCYNCHEYLNTTVGVQMGIRTIEWNMSTAEVTYPGVAVKILANDCKILGGIVEDTQIGNSVGIQVGDGTHAPVNAYVDTKILTTEGGAVNFSNSGGYNFFNLSVFQEAGTPVIGTAVNTDNVNIKTPSEINGLALGSIPQGNRSILSARLPDPSGTAGWYKLGTWYTGGSGGSRLRIQIIGTGGYNADISSAGRTVITCSTGNGTPTPNIQGVFYNENGNALLDNVKAKKGADIYTWDIYVHLLATFTGNAFLIVDTGSETYACTFIYSLASGSDPGSASSTVAVFTQRFQMESYTYLDGGATVNNNLTANGTQQTFNSYTQINGALDVLGGNMRVDNSANNVGVGVFVGKDDGNQFTNFILADATYPLDANPGGHYWAFSHRHDHSFLIFNYNGAGTYTNVVKGLETGEFQILNGPLRLQANGSLGGHFYSGSGAPNITGSVAGDYYFRTDTPSTANQRIYVATGSNTWTGIV